MTKELMSYHEVVNQHSPVVADYIFRHLERSESEQFKLKGIDKEKVEQLIEEWVKC
jgi:hypothetical protein